MIPRLKSLWRKEVCPYCFEEYRLRDAPFRCASPGSRCKQEVDEVRKRFWDESMPMGRVLGSDGKLVHEMRCPECSQISRKRLCPHCHMELPHTTGKFDNLIFAVIGAKESGKSHYIAVLIDQLRKHVGPGLDMLLEPLDDATVKRYREAFHDPLYRDGTVIRGTVSALADRKVQMPLVYSLTFGGRGPFGGRRIRKAVTLVFFDTAGEDLNSEDRMTTVNKYIYRSDGIILLLDPLQLSWVRDQLGSTTPLPVANTETSDIITRVERLVLKGRGMAPDAMVPTPLAVAFSKFDAVEPLVDPQLQLNADAHHDGAYDVADFSAVDAEMRSLLAQWDSESIPHQLRTRFKQFGFFGLTALGCNPHGDQKVPRVLPRRVEDPFLWLLYRHGLIPAVGEGRLRYLLRTEKAKVAALFLIIVVGLILLFASPWLIGGGPSRPSLSPVAIISPSTPGAAPPGVSPPDPGVKVLPPPRSNPSPVRVTEIRLRNETHDGTPLSDFTTRFRRRELRYLSFYVTLENRRKGSGVSRGRLSARYVRSDGKLMLAEDEQQWTSVALEAEVTDEITLAHGIGHPDRSLFQRGGHEVQIWWDSQLIGLQRFEVVP